MMRRLGKLDDGDDGREARTRRREVAGSIAGFVRRYVDRGGTLPDVREALRLTFRAETVAMLGRLDPILSPRARVDTLPPVVERAARIANGLPHHERIVAVLEQAGVRGMTKTDLVKRFPRPRPATAEIDVMLGELVEASMISAETMKITVLGKAGLRLFHGAIGAPRTIDGIAVFD